MAAPFPPPAMAPMMVPASAPPPTYFPVRLFLPTPSLPPLRETDPALIRYRRPPTVKERKSSVTSLESGTRLTDNCAREPLGTATSPLLPVMSWLTVAATMRPAFCEVAEMAWSVRSLISLPAGNTATVWATPADNNANTRENIEASAWHERCQVITGDARIVHLGRKYDFIVSNPPFYQNDLKSGDAKRNLALHSESLSLEELLLVIKKHLNKEGKFALLLPYHRKNEFEKLATAEGFFLEEEVSVKQTPTHPFFRAMLLFGTVSAPVNISTITIRDEDQYTPEFTALLKDYYLNL